MPHRLVNIWTVFLGVAGLVLVVLMVMFGADLVRASRTGPRWKRALVAASLSLMAVLGVAPRQSPAAEKAPPPQVAGDSERSPVMAVFNLESELEKLAELTSSADFDGAAAGGLLKNVDASVAILSKEANLAKLTPKGRARVKVLMAAAAKQTALTRALIPIGTTNLARSPQWEIVCDAWSYVTPLADSHRSSTPQRLVAAEKLATAGKAISALSAAGLLSSAEAAMLVIDSTRLRTDLLADPPTDSRITCYDYAVMPAVRLSVTNLSKRVALFKKVIAEDRMSPPAMDRIIERVQRELDQLTDPKLTKALRTAPERAEAEKLHAEVSALVVQVKCKVLGLRLNQTSGWKNVETALIAAAPLAKTHRSTSAQRVAISKRMTDAKAQLAALATSGLLSAAEAELLTGELVRLQKEIYREAPIDSRVSCYETLAPDPVGDSTKRLEKRIPLLRKLFDSGKLNPLVAGKVLPSISADIKTLKDAKKAEALRKQAATLLTQIDNKYSGGPK